MVGEKGVSVSKDQHELLKNVLQNHKLKFDDNTPSLCYGTNKNNLYPKMIVEECNGTP